MDAATGELIWEYKRKLARRRARCSRAGHQPQPGDLRQRRSSTPAPTTTSSRSTRTTGKLRLGDADRRLPEERAPRRRRGPIIANGKIISGRRCRAEGGRDACVITAHDAKTGKELWRTHTIPAARASRATKRGATCRYEQRWHVGTWMVPSYDPELNLIYVGTSVTIPAPKFMLGGNDKQHLYHNCTLALNADTGKIVWYYQHIVDHWDLDHPFERLLVDTAVAPIASDVTLDQPEAQGRASGARWSPAFPGKTGIVYTLDRQTGEFLWARPTVVQNVISTIDGATGEVTVNPRGAVHRRSAKRRFVCPGSNGGKNWPAGAYSPLTNTMYYAAAEHVHDGATTTATRATRRRSTASACERRIAPGTDKVGTVRAISAETGRDDVEVRAARRHAVARRDRRRAGLRRRRQRPVQARSTTRRARCCGRRISARRSAAIR